MKRMPILLTISTILLLILACTINFGGEAAAGADELPLEAVVDSPLEGNSLPEGSIQIKYHATAPDGIAAVELSINGEVVSNVASPEATQTIVALQYTWNPTLSGNHVIRVRAQGANGSWSGYGMVSVNIVGEEPPAEEQQEQEPESEPEEEVPAEPEELAIINVQHDVNKFYYLNGTCGPKKITFTAEVNKPDEEYLLLIFTRFEDLEGGGLTKWDASHSMSKIPSSEGKFTITLESEKLQNYNTFEIMLMHFQLVVQDKPGGSRIAATEVFKTEVRLERCP